MLWQTPRSVEDVRERKLGFLGQRSRSRRSGLENRFSVRASISFRFVSPALFSRRLRTRATRHFTRVRVDLTGFEDNYFPPFESGLERTKQMTYSTSVYAQSTYWEKATTRPGMANLSQVKYQHLTMRNFKKISRPKNNVYLLRTKNSKRLYKYVLYDL